MLRKLSRWLRRFRGGPGPHHPSGLPIPEARILRAARKAGAHIPPDAPLRIDRCHALRRASDGKLIGYSVAVQVDPHLGVP